MEIDSLRKLYVEELKDLYSAEKQILTEIYQCRVQLIAPFER